MGPVPAPGGHRLRCGSLFSGPEQVKLEGMAKVSRSDWIIGIVLVAVLLALFGVAVARRLGDETAQARTATLHPATTTGADGHPGGPTGDPGTAATAGTVDPAPTTTPTTSASTTTSTTTGSAAAAGPEPVAGPVTAVGDSIMIDIQPALEADIPGVRVDGLVSRQFETGIGVVQADRAAGSLGRVLVVELGTNGTVTSADFDAMMQAASGVARVVFVNVNVPRSWEAPDNAVLAAGVARYPGVAVLADWNTVSSGHPEWFTPDQVHLEPAGAEALANLIASYA
jgi:hypothetical protein